MENYIGQWITLYNKFKYSKIIGYVAKISDDGDAFLIKVTYPKSIYGNFIIVDLDVDNYVMNEIEIGELTEEDRKFLIDVALLFRDKEWFVELTKGVIK